MCLCGIGAVRTKEREKHPTTPSDYQSAPTPPEALRNRAAALAAVDGLIAQGKTFAAPRPYPGLARPGELWVEAQPYWIACRTEQPRAILAVFYATTDIPGRRQRPPD